MSDRTNIIARVRKLLAFNNENATEGEVENALAAAQRLMEAHAIEQAELAESAAPPVVERVRVSQPLPTVTLSLWETRLAAAVLKAVPGVSNYSGVCQPFRGKRHAAIHWFGPCDLVEVAQDLFETTRQVIATLAKGRFGGVYRGTGRSYCEGFTSALFGKVTEAAASTALATRIVAIVLRATAENRAWLLEAHGVRLRDVKRTSSGKTDQDAWHQGKQDGRNYDLTPGRPSGKLGPSPKCLPPA